MKGALSKPDPILTSGPVAPRKRFSNPCNPAHSGVLPPWTRGSTTGSPAKSCRTRRKLDSNRPAHFARLLKILRRKGRTREDAEDLIQEAMLRLHLYAKSDVVVNEEAFLIHAVRNLAVDRYRRDRSMEGREVQIDDVDRQHPLIAQSPTPNQIPGPPLKRLFICALIDLKVTASDMANWSLDSRSAKSRLR
jgi:hypothetical protein